MCFNQEHISTGVGKDLGPTSVEITQNLIRNAVVAFVFRTVGKIGAVRTDAGEALVNDILELSHLDEGMGDMVREDVDLYEVAIDAVNSLEEEARAANVSLDLTGEQSIINGYARLLSLIVYNLCENGIKYNNPRGSVKVDVNNFDDRIVLTVNDNGIGIPLDQQERVFEDRIK